MTGLVPLPHTSFFYPLNYKHLSFSRVRLSAESRYGLTHDRLLILP